MRRAIAILLGVALLASADAVLARGGRGGGGHAGGGGFHGGGTSMGFHGGRGGIATVGAHIGPPLGRPFLGGRPRPVFGRPPPLFHRPPAFSGRPILLRAPLFYPY